MDTMIHGKKICTVRLPQGAVAEIDRLVNDGFAMNRADFIRGAIYNRLRE